MKKLILISLLFVLNTAAWAQPSPRKVQVALLLDTSNSMDGLIEQAKSQLWNIVNTLTTLKFEGKTPEIEISLYEYGNDGLDAAEHHVRQVAPLTKDLDLISEKLFSLKTNGGNEYCGSVIGKSLKQLDWSGNEKDMKLIYIAGNEPFSQGPVSYTETCKDAVSKNIFVNAIYCGSKEEGVNGLWKDGADKGGGKYFNIDQNRAVIYIETPYDIRINELNINLNNTYIGYGASAAPKMEMQRKQDANASGLSAANAAERAVTKASSAYRNADWDLVDAVKEKKVKIEELKDEELTGELKGKSKKEIEEYVKKKEAEREKVQKEIAELSKKRSEYIAEKQKESAKTDDLGNAVVLSLKEQAKRLGYSF